jgi:hypothetical protein
MYKPTIQEIEDLKAGKIKNARNWDLFGANLYGANLRYANLNDANLYGADLCGANLCDANLRHADLRGANLSGANLSGADLRGTNLCYAYLRYADLSGANLNGANLNGANLNGANLSGADLRDADFFASQCPEEGSFIGYKKCKGKIVKLRITENAKRSSATSRKCRCSEAEVLEIDDGNYTKISSNFTSNFIYEIGKISKVDNFDENRWNECSTGIHFFITRKEAENYQI